MTGFSKDCMKTEGEARIKGVKRPRFEGEARIEGVSRDEIGGEGSGEGPH